MSHELQILPSQTSGSSVPLPLPRIAINIRTAAMEDFAAIDAIQKAHHKQLGFFPRGQMEGYLKNGWVIIAEDETTRALVGYCASRDRYLKRDELGAIFQLCVAEGHTRKFVGMALLKHVFEHAPYGCGLFCCWCAQDIEANRFWESMGFVPLAFRTGSARKSRVHIFWQKRIRQGDETTPWWFPSQTGGGAIREDRLVLPIPPGMHWSDAKPIILPGTENVEEPKRLPSPRQKRAKELPAKKQTTIIAGGLKFEIPKETALAKAKSKRANAGGDFGELSRAAPTPRKKQKNDPKLVAAARELRDRWLEKVNSDGFALEAQGKYEVSKTLSSTLSAVEGPALSAVEGSAVEGSAVEGPALSRVEGGRLPAGEMNPPPALVEQAPLCLPLPVAA